MTSDEPEAPNGTTPTPPRYQSNWTFGRVIGMVFTSIAGLIGLALLIGGLAVLAAYAFGRDDDGYFASDREHLDSATYAITTENIDLGEEAIDWAPDEVLGDVRIQVDADAPIFVGIGPDANVDRYLRDVAHDELTGFNDGEPEFASHEGARPKTAPSDQGLWVAKTEGAGEQELTWDAEFGQWTAVVMNADATRGVDVEANAAVKLDWVIWVGLGMFVVGLLMTAGAVVVVLLIGRRASAPASA